MKKDITYPVPPEGEVKELIFTCPECGSNRLTLVETGITAYSRILLISSEGWITYDDPDIECAYAEIASYQCALCKYELEDDYGVEILNEEELVEWLRNNNGYQRESKSDE